MDNMLENDTYNAIKYAIKYELPEIAKQLAIANRLKTIELNMRFPTAMANLNKDTYSFIESIRSMNMD